MFFKMAFVNGHKSSCLADTRSAKTLIRTSAVKRFELIVTPVQNNILRSFMKTTIVCNQSTQLSIRITEVTCTVDAIIVDEKFLTQELLIMRDFIEKQHIMIRKKIVLYLEICQFQTNSLLMSLSDCESAFTSNTFESFCKCYGIKYILNTVATPRANGQCKRYNKTIINALATTSACNAANKCDCYVKQRSTKCYQ